MWYYRNRKQKFESELISNCIEVCYKEVDIEASKPASSTPIRYEYYFVLSCTFSDLTVCWVTGSTYLAHKMYCYNSIPGSPVLHVVSKWGTLSLSLDCRDAYLKLGDKATYISIMGFLSNHISMMVACYPQSELQCFDTVSWVTGRIKLS